MGGGGGGGEDAYYQVSSSSLPPGACTYLFMLLALLYHLIDGLLPEQLFSLAAVRRGHKEDLLTLVPQSTNRDARNDDTHNRCS